jgi:hypothetical protein
MLGSFRLDCGLFVMDAYAMYRSHGKLLVVFEVVSLYFVHGWKDIWKFR